MRKLWGPTSEVKKTEFKNCNRSNERNFRSVPSFFQKCSKLVQEEKSTLELTHTMLECKKENVTVEGKSWSCCPKNWKPFGSNCYFVSSEIKNWIDSEKHCAEMQAHLLVVDSKEEQEFLKNNLNKDYPYYVGLSDLKNGHWEWVNEKPYNPSVTFWHPGEPSNDDEHCVIDQQQNNPEG
nr:unnamed protein product [Sorex araneus]